MLRKPLARKGVRSAIGMHAGPRRWGSFGCVTAVPLLFLPVGLVSHDGDKSLGPFQFLGSGKGDRPKRSMVPVSRVSRVHGLAGARSAVRGARLQRLFHAMAGYSGLLVVFSGPFPDNLSVGRPRRHPHGRPRVWADLSSIQSWGPK